MSYFDLTNMTICHILKEKGGENMTHTIEDLWNGELAFCEHCGAYDPEANRLVRELAFRDGFSAGVKLLTEGLYHA